MKKIVALWVVMAGLLFGDTLGWSSDYEAALKEAKAQNKNVYMLITSADCRWCRKFENTTLQEEIVISKLEEKYVLLHVDRDEHSFPEKFNRAPVPRHYFITANEDVIYTFLGYWQRDDFFSYLGDVDKRLKSMQNN